MQSVPHSTSWSLLPRSKHYVWGKDVLPVHEVASWTINFGTEATGESKHGVLGWFAGIFNRLIFRDWKLNVWFRCRSMVKTIVSPGILKDTEDAWIARNTRTKIWRISYLRVITIQSAKQLLVCALSLVSKRFRSEDICLSRIQCKSVTVLFLPTFPSFLTPVSTQSSFSTVSCLRH